MGFLPLLGSQVLVYLPTCLHQISVVPYTEWEILLPLRRVGRGTYVELPCSLLSRSMFPCLGYIYSVEDSGRTTSVVDRRPGTYRVICGHGRRLTVHRGYVKVSPSVIQ